MKRIIDIHSHILPRVDDGCQSEYEAKKMLEMYEAQNVEAVICTPHYGVCALLDADVDGAYKWIKSVDTNVNLYLGNEILMDKDVFKSIRDKKARPLAGSGFYLIEFEDWSYCSTADEILIGCATMASIGYNVILAHPERYFSLQLHEEYYDRIAKFAYLQINAYDICDTDDNLAKRACQYMLKRKLVTFIGSDAHGADRRPPKLTNGIQWIYDHCETEYADAIVHDNAAKIIREGN